jgi:hypothetical protein
MTGSPIISRFRGPTKGKGVQREVDKNKGEKLRVEVCPLACTFVGKNATKIANQLGVQIRLSAPLQGISTWTQIDRGSKDAIIQNVLVNKYVNYIFFSSLCVCGGVCVCVFD